jgi:hypothetical protein
LDAKYKILIAALVVLTLVDAYSRIALFGDAPWLAVLLAFPFLGIAYYAVTRGRRAPAEREEDTWLRSRSNRDLIVRVLVLIVGASAFVLYRLIAER